MNKFKLLLCYFVLMLSSVSHASDIDNTEDDVARVVNNECIGIYSASKFSDSFDKDTICNQDYAMNSLNMLFSHAYERSENIRKIYDYFDMPAPTGGTVGGMNSGLVTTLSDVAVGLFLFIAAPIAFVCLLLKSYKVMQTSSLSNEFKRPENWGAFGFFSLACMLAYVSDGFMFGQALVVGIAGWALAFANLGLTAVAGFFSFNASSAESLANPNDYLQEGEKFAADVITSAMVARNSALVLNRANNNMTEVNVLKSKPRVIEDAFFSMKAGWIDEFFISERVEKPPTVGDYFKNMLGASSTKITFKTPLWEAPMSTVSHHGSITTLQKGNWIGDVYPEVVVSISPISNTNDGKNMVTNYYPIVHDQDKVFEDAHIGDIKGVSGLRYADHLKTLIDDDLDSFFIKIQGLTALPDTETIKDLGEQLKRKAEKFAKNKTSNLDKQAELRDQYIKTAQANLLGLYNKEQVRATSYDDVVEYFNPLDKSTIGKGKVTSSPIYWILRNAFTAAEQMSAYNCTKMLLNSQTYSNVFAEIRQNKLATKKDELATTALGLSDKGYGQCFSQIAGSPIFLMDSKISAPLGEMLTDTTLGMTEEKIFRALKNTTSMKNATAADKHLAEARVRKNNIAYYYAGAMAATRYALLKSKLSENDKDQQDIITNLRQNGASALMAYFFRLNMVQDKFRNALSLIVPTDKIVNTANNAELLPSFKTEKMKQELSLGFKEFGNDFRTPLLSKGLFGNISPQDIQRKESQEAETDISSYIIDMMLPGDDILKKGFGFDMDKTLIDNYESCGLTTNCINFNQHPIVTMSQFGKDLVETSVVVIIVNAVIKKIASIDIGSYLEAMDDSLFGSIMPDFIVEKVKVAGMSAGKMWSFVMGIIAIISGIAASFSVVLLGAGLALAYMLPLIPILGQLLLWVAWLLEVLTLFIIFPILVGLMIIRINGRPLLPMSALVGMFASVFLKPLLYIVVFVCYFTITYVAFYLVNSIMFFIINDVSIGSNGGVMSWLMDAIGSAVSIFLVIYIYFKMLLKLNEDTLHIPELILNYIGVKSFKVAAVSGLESMITTGAITKHIQSGATIVGSGIGGAANFLTHSKLKSIVKKNAGQNAANKAQKKSFENSRKY